MVMASTCSDGGRGRSSAAKRGRGSGVPKPRGRAPPGKVWDATSGAWVPKPAAAAAAAGAAEEAPPALPAPSGGVAGDDGGGPPPPPSSQPAGDDLPGWTIEQRQARGSGKTYRVFVGPNGERASSRAHAKKGGNAAAAGDCLAQAAPGPELMRTPEPQFFVCGAKSYGRNSAFLLTLGHAQVEAVVGILEKELAPQPGLA